MKCYYDYHVWNATTKYTFIMQTSKEHYGTLKPSIFPVNFNLGLFKARVNKFLDRRTPS